MALKRTIHTPPHVCFSYFAQVCFSSLLSGETSACFFPAPGHLNPTEYPLLLTRLKLRFRFYLSSQKKKRILHILFFARRSGPASSGAPPLRLSHICWQRLFVLLELVDVLSLSLPQSFVQVYLRPADVSAALPQCWSAVLFFFFYGIFLLE